MGREYIPIFPFGCNNSQYKAVKNAMENQISVIQGPPGTSKTQTILNIIDNILMQGSQMVTEQEYFNRYVDESDVDTESIKFKKKTIFKTLDGIVAGVPVETLEYFFEEVD